MNISDLLKDFKTNFPKIDENLTLCTSPNELNEEFFYWIEHEGECRITNSRNKIIHYFQQDTFYAIEKQLWKNNSIKHRILANRIKYLNKTHEQLTTQDILSGFKQSGLYYGYSCFNPLLAKWFYEQYHSKISYDPCGGWGHRALGATVLDKYIYNDLSSSTAKNVKQMCQYFDMYNVEVHNQDARTYIPKDDFDSMFTCLPYFNLEHYACGDFKDMEDYKNFLDSLFHVFEQKNSCQVFGLVLREDLLCGHDNYTERIDIHPKKADHLIHKKQYSEYLYIYTKKKSD